jgi:hypothetical protein
MLEAGRPPEVFYLLRQAARLGAKLDISDDGATLIVEPETAIPDNLRNLIFAAEPECLAALRGFQQIQRSFEELVEIAQKADVVRGQVRPRSRG